MRLKKLTAAVLATTMILGSTLVASAAEMATDDAGGYSSKVSTDSTVTTPTIDVTLPTSAALKIDPFNIGDKGQIDSTPQAITNESNVPISIGLGMYAVKKTDACDITLATAKLKGTETTKSVFIYADFISTAAETPAADEKHAEFDAKSTAQMTLAYGTDAKYTTKSNLITLAKGVDADGTTAAPVYANVQLMGEAATKTTKAWADTDIITVNMIYKISPVLPTP